MWRGCTWEADTQSGRGCRRSSDRNWSLVMPAAQRIVGRAVVCCMCHLSEALCSCPFTMCVPSGRDHCCRHAAELAHNRLLRASLAAFARAGGVVYAECGGLLYLSKSVQPQDEPARPMGAAPASAAALPCKRCRLSPWIGCCMLMPRSSSFLPLIAVRCAPCLFALNASTSPACLLPYFPLSPSAVGVFPFKTVMTQNKMTMGYVEVETGAGCPLFPAGRTVRGQVYHFSEIVQVCVVLWLGVMIL